MVGHGPQRCSDVIGPQLVRVMSSFPFPRDELYPDDRLGRVHQETYNMTLSAVGRRQLGPTT